VHAVNGVQFQRAGPGEVLWASSVNRALGQERDSARADAPLTAAAHADRGQSQRRRQMSGDSSRALRDLRGGLLARCFRAEDSARPGPTTVVHQISGDGAPPYCCDRRAARARAFWGATVTGWSPSAEWRLTPYPSMIVRYGCARRDEFAWRCRATARTIHADEPTLALDATVQVRADPAAAGSARTGHGHDLRSPPRSWASPLRSPTWLRSCMGGRMSKAGRSRGMGPRAGGTHTLGEWPPRLLTVHGHRAKPEQSRDPRQPPDMRGIGRMGCAFAPPLRPAMPDGRLAVPYPRFSGARQHGWLVLSPWRNASR